MAASILAPGRLEFTDALDASVKRNVVLPDDYYGKRIGTAKSRAFSVAGLHDTAQLQVIFDSLNESIKNGEGFLDWKQKITAAGIKLPDYRLENIFRTNVQSAYAAGQWRQMTEDNPDRYLMYDAINDSRTRPSHRAWDGLILKASDSFWSTHAPPNGFNCYLPDSQIWAGNLNLGLRSLYQGPAIELEFSSGRKLTVTANHPISTAHGMRAAHTLCEGDYCVSDVAWDKRPVVSPIVGKVNNHQIVMRAEDCFHSMSNDGFGIVDRSAFDFHGDMHLRRGNIDVAGVDTKLIHGFNSMTPQFIANDHFIFPNKRRLVANSLMAIRAPFGDSGVHAEFFYHALNVWLATAKIARNGGGAIGHIAIEFCNLFLKRGIHFVSGLPSRATLSLDCGISYFFNRLPFNKLGLALSSQLNMLAQKSSNSRARDSYLFAKSVDADTGNISVDSVIGKREFSYHGFVYDFQADDGLIIGSGIVTSNCRCTLIALSDKEAAKRGITSNDKLFGLPKPDAGWDFNPGLGGEEDLDQAKIIALMKRPEIARPILTKVEERATNATRTLEEYKALGKTIADELVNVDQLDDPAHVAEAFIAFRKRLNKAVGNTKIEIEGAPISATLVQAAARAFPASWIDASNDFRLPLKTELAAGRGGISRKEGYDLVKVRDFANAVHELTHRLQRVLPDLDDYFQVLHVERTAGDPLKSLRKFDKRYEAIEKTREDEYANPYMGKEYPDSATRAGALELMPMTMQYLLGSADTFGWIADDEELFKLALGLLFHYVP